MTQLRTPSAVRATTGSGNNIYLVLSVTGWLPSRGLKPRSRTLRARDSGGTSPLEARVPRALRLGDLALVDEVELDLRRVDGVGVSVKF